MLDSHHAGTAVPSDPRPDPGARADRAGHVAAHHRPPRPQVRGARAGLPGRSQTRLPDAEGPRHPLSRVGHRRVGSGDREHAVSRRPRARVRERSLLDGLRADRRGVRHRVRACRGPLRRRCGRRRARAAPPRGRRSPIQGPPRRPQRDLHGRHLECRGPPRRPRPRRPPRAPPRGHRVVARVDRFQKGLMLPPGMAILAISERALTASDKARCPRSYWDWRRILERNRRGEFPYTPATMLLFGLEEALKMLDEEGLPNVFKRHWRLAEACRRAVRALGLAILCRNPAEYSNTLTAVVMPPGFD